MQLGYYETHHESQDNFRKLSGKDMRRTAFALWQGGLKTGNGTLTIQDSSVCNVPFSYLSRFEGEVAMSPEGLIAAAHAASFVMSFAEQLETRSLVAERIDAGSTVSIEELDGSHSITQLDLELVVHTAALPRGQIIEAAKVALGSCPVSRMIRAEITLKVRVEGVTHFFAA